ncbi:14-3-3 protein [Oopsacas minuta]|uniref:14-3-3 protein n=1 Tax=Oopsacas minuta TaxID=111878 RepID=A0AAV7JZ69_9METZ|nr:14-3-3 protein [Oopsacas minuta]
MSTRAELIQMAKLAEQGERFDDMVEYMKEVAQSSEKMAIEDRNLLSVAYKNIVGSRRNALRILGSIKDKEERKEPDGYKLKTVIEYRDKLEAELDALCLELLDQVLNDAFLGRVEECGSQVFFLKMKGDYYRYMAEYKEGEALKQVCTQAEDCYSKAWATASKELSATDPIRLGLVLNYSVFHFEIMNESEEACKLAKQSFEEAKSGIDDISDENYKDSMLILQLLRDNLSLWTQDEPSVDPIDDEPGDIPKQDDGDDDDA